MTTDPSDGLTAERDRPATLTVRDPATGAALAELRVDGAADVEVRVHRARRALAGWSAQPYDRRAAALGRFAELLVTEVDEGAAVLTAETGKPVTQARAEITAAADRVAWFVENVPTVLAPEVVGTTDGTAEEVTRDPVGVVAHVGVWNYPYFVALNSIAPALLVGDAVLYKPSELASLTGRRITELLHRAGVPDDVVQVVVGDGTTGAALVAADLDMVCFTGSFATGRAVAATLAPRLVRVQLELGGKDPAYVCDDVDVAATAPALAEGVFYNAGQSCCAIERLYVHRSVLDDVVEHLVEQVRAYRVGDPTDPATDVGPLARPGQVELLEAQIADARERGATVVAGGGRRPGRGQWFEPTVLVDVDHSMRVMREESFGPVIGVQGVDDDDEAVRLMADTEYGLTAAVFSNDPERATAVLDRLDVGSAYWNCADRTTVRLPWAGRRHSGLGVSLGLAGIRALTREKAWHRRPPAGRGG